MEKGEKFQRKKIGNPEYINKNCWLAKTINHSVGERCQYCESKFRNCLFFQYLITSLILILFLFTLSFLIEGKISKLLIISIFVLVIVYGRFFNKSTEKIIKANFAQRKAKEALEELAENLQQKVEEQTKEIRKAYEVEKHAHQELKRLDEVKTQFTMAIQHHLRTPLTSIIGYLELILSGTYGKTAPKVTESLLKLRVSTKRLIKMVNEFLDIAQFQLGKEVVSLKPNIQIEPIIKEIIEELRFETGTKKIYLKLEKPERVFTIKADPEKLKAALFNIIDNAVKYTQKGGVTVRIKNNGFLRIEVQDTGIGVPEEQLKTLFEKTFERGEIAKKTFTTGRGIGLYIASQIIKTHNGKIWAESKGKDRGSTFFVELPMEMLFIK